MDHTLEDGTPLIPELIAERISQSVVFIDYASDRARRCYQNNRYFRKQMHTSNCRELLEMFMFHWYEGWMKGAIK